MMNPKEIVLEFYKSDVLLDTHAVDNLIHREVLLDWNSSKGFVQMNRDDIINLSKDLQRAYVRSKIKITHIIAENNIVAVRYSHFVKTIENPREDMLLANFFVIWEVKDNKLYRGYQMSQF